MVRRFSTNACTRAVNMACDLNLSHPYYTKYEKLLISGGRYEVFSRDRNYPGQIFQPRKKDIQFLQI